MAMTKEAVAMPAGMLTCLKIADGQQDECGPSTKEVGLSEEVAGLEPELQLHWIPGGSRECASASKIRDWRTRTWWRRIEVR